MMDFLTNDKFYCAPAGTGGAGVGIKSSTRRRERLRLKHAARYLGGVCNPLLSRGHPEAGIIKQG